METFYPFKNRTKFKKKAEHARWAVLLLFAASLVGCKKEVQFAQESLAFEQGIAAIPTPTFDRETADHMPTAPGAAPVLVPFECCSGWFPQQSGAGEPGPKNLKTKIELKGEMSSNSGIASPTLTIPGTKWGKNAVGYVPA